MSRFIRLYRVRLTFPRISSTKVSYLVKEQVNLIKENLPVGEESKYLEIFLLIVTGWLSTGEFYSNEEIPLVRDLLTLKLIFTFVTGSCKHGEIV